MADDPKLLCASQDKAKLETRNGVEQLDYIAELVNTYRSETFENPTFSSFTR